MKPISLILGEDPAAAELSMLRAEEDNLPRYVDDRINASLLRIFPGQDPKKIRKRYPKTIRHVREQLIEQMKGKIAFTDNLLRHI